jgi:DNA-binding transcriptional LysR family regulator
MAMPGVQAMLAFRRVVELHSFTAAAHSLDMTGGAVSKVIAHLEKILGARLLNRTTRTVSLTEEGTGFYEAVVRILDEIEAAADQARSQSSSPAGLLRTSVPSSFALVWLATRVPAFLAQYGGLKLDLALNDRFVDLVAEGIDCAIRITDGLPDSTLVARRIGSVDRLVVASPRYLKRAPALSAPEHLKAHNCLLYTQTSTPTEWPLRGAKHGTIEVSGSYRVNSSVMLREALVAGCGLALTPRFVVEDLLREGALVEVLRPHRPQPHVIYGVIANHRYVPQKVRVFLDFVSTWVDNGDHA